MVEGALPKPPTLSVAEEAALRRRAIAARELRRLDLIDPLLLLSYVIEPTVAMLEEERHQVGQQRTERPEGRPV